MYYLTILIGAFLGLSLFIFLFIIAKKTGLYYLPPLITFLIAVSILVYSLWIEDVGRIDYGLLGIGFLVAAVGSTLLLPAKLKTWEKRTWTKVDVIGLFVFLYIIVLSIILFINIDIDDCIILIVAYYVLC